jgi:hypothetical protein
MINTKVKDKTSFFIYELKNNKTKDFYIGVTTNPNKRLINYKKYKETFKNQRFLYEAITKSDISDWSIEILDYGIYSSIHELSDIENDYIYKSYIKNPDRCLNIKGTGRGYGLERN